MGADGRSPPRRRPMFIGAVAGAWALMGWAAAPAVAQNNDFYQQPFGVLFSGSPVTDSNTSAGIQTGEPLTPAGPGGCGTANRKMVATKWYWFIGNGGEISLNTVGSNFDTVIAAYEGSTPGSDDPLPCSDDAGGALTSALSFPSVAERSYLLQVGGCSECGTTNVGSIVLNASAAPPPAAPAPAPTPVPVPVPVPVPAPAPVVIHAKPSLRTSNYYRRVGGKVVYLGLTVERLVVSGLRDRTLVTIRCSDRECRGRSLRADKTRRVEFVFPKFPKFRKYRREMPTGTKIKVWATLPGATGAYVRYRIGPNRLSKVQRCLAPGSLEPQRC